MCDERRANLLDAVREGELELGDQKLLDVGAANIVGLLDLDNAEDLKGLVSFFFKRKSGYIYMSRV